MLFTELQKKLLLVLGLSLWLIGLGSKISLDFFLNQQPDISKKMVLPPLEKRHEFCYSINEIFKDTNIFPRIPINNSNNPFIPPPPPAPPKPKTKTVTVTYSGFFITTHGEKWAVVYSENNLITGPVGTTVVDDFKITNITDESIVIASSSTNLFKINFKDSARIEIPVK
jgi:hypothetical protein